MSEMIIQQKVFQMMKYGYICLQQYPKSEKFALVVDIKRCMNTILERVVEGSKKDHKKTTLRDLDVEVAKLKVYIRLSHELGFLPLKKYELWSEKVVEIAFSFSQCVFTIHHTSSGHFTQLGNISHSYSHNNFFYLNE